MDALVAEIYWHILDTDPNLDPDDKEDVQCAYDMAGLIALGLLEIKEPGVYELTAKGRQEADRIVAERASEE